MIEGAERAVRVPPRRFVRTAWKVHRALLRVTQGRKGLWTPSTKRGWGVLRLTTQGRRSGEERVVMVGYLEDGPNVFALAMNGWGEGEPSWWLNLQADPRATVQLRGAEPREMVAHAAEGAERERLWARWREVEQDLDKYAARRTTPTAIVVLTPADTSTGLFVYGTLAPGRPNEHILADLHGTWEPGWVRGKLLPDGWGAALGYPAIVLDDEGPDVRGLLFRSPELDHHWERLDEFEGDGYDRVLATVRLDSGRAEDAYIYTLRGDPD